MAELTVYANYRVWFYPEVASNEPVENQPTVYQTQHDLTSTDACATTVSGAYYIGQRYYGPLDGIHRWMICRVGLYFDTSSIPEDANISSAVLQLYVNSVHTTLNSYDIVIQNGQPTYPHNPVEEGDYYYGNYSDDGGSIHTDDLTTGERNDITLNTDWITKAGETKLMLRNSRDISSLVPTTASGDYQVIYEWINIGAKTNKPKLVITYSEAAITTDAASEIGYWAAMGNGTIDAGEPIERGFEVKLSYSGTLGNYVFHSVAGFEGTVSYNLATGKWEGTLTKTETETGTFEPEAFELVLGHTSIFGNPDSRFNDKLFKCESYTYRAYMVIGETTYTGDWVAFDTLCDDGEIQQPTDDISEGNPVEPIIPIEPIEWELPEFIWEMPEIELPPWILPDLPAWEFPDYPPMSFIGDFYYRKPYTKKDLDDLRKKCIIYSKNSIEFALVLRHNMNVLREFFNMMTDYMDKEEFNDFTDLIPPQRLKELYLDPLNPTDFRDMINGFIRNTIDNNIAVNRNFKLIQDGLSDYETESDDAYFKEINSNIKTVTEDNPDVHRLKRKIDSLNQEVSLNFGNIMRNLKIIRARLL